MIKLKRIRKTVLLDDNLAKGIERLTRKHGKDFSDALRYAARIGLIAIENPDLRICEIKDIIEAKVEYQEGVLSDLNIRTI